MGRRVPAGPPRRAALAAGGGGARRGPWPCPKVGALTTVDFLGGREDAGMRGDCKGGRERELWRFCLHWRKRKET